MQATETKSPTLPSQEDDSLALRAEFFAISQIENISHQERVNLMAKATVKALHGRGRFFFHSDHKDYDTAMFFDSRRKLLLWISSDEFSSWLSEFVGVNTAEKLFTCLYAATQVEALAGNTSGIIPSKFFESKNGAVYISSGCGHMVKIIPSGVEPCDNGTDGVLFASGFALQKWTITNPIDPFDACSLWNDAAFVNEHGKELLRLWALSLPTNQRCKPPIVLSGPIGSGKSRAIYGLFDLFGLPPRIGAITKSGEDNFWISMNHGGLFCLDNADTRVPWLADSMAAAATDGSHEKRRLYKDEQVLMMRARSWLAITSANPTFASDAGLADRLIVLRLNTRPAGSTSESTLTDEVLAIRDAALSFVAITIQKALADTAPTTNAINRRHPDFANFAVRLGRALGREEQAIAAMRSAETDKSLFNLENDSVGCAIMDYFRQDETGLTTSLSGSAKEILDALGKTDEFIHDHWTPKKLSNSISRIWPHLQAHMRAEKKIGLTGAFTFTFRKPETLGI